MPGMVGPNRDEQEPDFLSAAARRRELRGGGKRRDMGREQRGETLGERRDLGRDMRGGGEGYWSSPICHVCFSTKTNEGENRIV